MPSVVDTLIEMGFSREKAELAVQRSGETDVQSAMDWLLSHEDELDNPEVAEIPPEEPVQQPLPSNEVVAESVPESIEEPIESAPAATSETPASPATAKSIQCDDCGKLFKTHEEVEFHASKSGHENFSESTEEKKPLSEEEKKAQLAKIEAKLKQRRLEREAREREEALLKEKLRIKSGKELLEAKKKHDEIEMKKIVEQRKREKEEERLARQRVKEQIEQDKLARKAKFSNNPAAVEAPQPVPPSQPVVQKASTTSYSEVKLQIRLPNGQSLSQSFGAKEPLSAVRVFVQMNRNDGEGPFTLMTNFPRKVFGGEDYDKPLETLGLAPASTLFVSKA